MEGLYNFLTVGNIIAVITAVIFVYFQLKYFSKAKRYRTLYADFFRKQSYDGEIYKAANPRNLAIAQYAETPEEVEQEQQKIEKQLVDFKLGLWREYTDSTKVNVDTKRRRVSRKAPKVSTGSTSSKSGSSMRDRRY